VSRRTTAFLFTLCLFIAGLFMFWPVITAHIPTPDVGSVIDRPEQVHPKKDNDDSKAACRNLDERPRYLAYDPDTKKDNFGPPVRLHGDTAAEREDSAVDDFIHRLSIDRAFAAATTLRLENHLDNAHYIARVRHYNRHHNAWCSGVQEVVNYLRHAQSVRITHSTAPYNTLWFVRGQHRTDRPKLRQGDVGGHPSTLLVVRGHGGKLTMWRLECGFQPVVLRPFRDIPPLKEVHVTRTHHPVTSTPHRQVHPRRPVTNNGGCGSHCTTRHVTKHTPAPKPKPRFTPKPTHTPCNCFKKPQASQAPLPAPKQTQSVPKTAPRAQPTKPANPSHPAPPKTGGYNGGSTSQPGATASPSPIPEMPSSAPTQTGQQGGF
jgi:hypothetical protein